MSGNGRPRFAMYGAASCGGCEIAVLNTGDAVLALDAAVEVVFWPVVMDGKYADVEAMPDGSIDVTLFNGAIRNHDNVQLARLMRRKSKILVAFGACATSGGIPGLANLVSSHDLLETVYGTPTTENPDHTLPAWRWGLPEGEIDLPRFEPILRTLDQMVQVDYAIPGCPPEPQRLREVIALLVDALQGRAELPPPGTVLGAGGSTVCDDCARQRGIRSLTSFARLQALPRIDPEICLLGQGIPCNGSGTRQGCGALCPAAGAPCIGCYGPPDGVIDQGARLIGAFASLIESNVPAEIDAILDGIPDPAGQFYRFGLARSLLRASKGAWADGGGDGTGEGAAASAVAAGEAQR